MPLYPYSCEACGHEFEKVVPSAADRGDVCCPACESRDVARAFGLPAVGRPRPAATNCRGDGPPCGRTGCGRLAAG
jgi:putative FmdB family regulatory protein